MIVVRPRGSHVTTSPSRAVSYLDDGRQVTWELAKRPHRRIACDAERLDQAVPRTLRHKFGVSDPESFFASWTRAEVSAKLSDIPILVWLQLHGLDETLSSADIRTWVVADRLIVVTTGATMRPARPAAEPFEGSTLRWCR